MRSSGHLARRSLPPTCYLHWHWRLPAQVWPALPVSRGRAVLGNTTTSVMGFCSAVTLAFATIFSLVAAALLAIAFSTDNWITINVNRKDLNVKVSLSLSPDPLPLMPTLCCRLEGLNNYTSNPNSSIWQFAEFVIAWSPVRPRPCVMLFSEYLRFKSRISAQTHSAPTRAQGLAWW